MNECKILIKICTAIIENIPGLDRFRKQKQLHVEMQLSNTDPRNKNIKIIPNNAIFPTLNGDFP